MTTEVELDPRRWIVLGVLCLALLMVGIDGTIVNVALPTLVREVHASASDLQWIVDGYTIIFASFLLIAGNTGDRLGRKRCLVGGLVIFTSGSLGCALVHTSGALIVLRGVQGFGAAFVMPATLSILTNVFTDAGERTRAIAFWAGVSGLGVAIGPLAGGYLLDHFWWGSIFLINVPLGAITIVAVLTLVRESKAKNPPRLDLFGTVLSAVGIVGLLFGIIQGPSEGWSDPIVVGSFVVALVFLTGFVLWERHTDHPILDMNFFKNARFTAASISVTLLFFAMFGSVFFVSQYLQFVLGYTPLQSGYRLLPVAVVLMVVAPISAKLVGRFGTKIIVALGLFVVAGALLLFSRATTTSGYGLIAAVLVLIGVGMGLAMAPATDSIMGSLPPDKAGVGSAMNDTTREIGGALGVAIIGSLASATYAATITSNPDFAKLRAFSPAAAAAVKNSVGAASVVAEKLPAPVGSALTSAANVAFVKGLSRGVLVAAVVALLGSIIAYVFLPVRAAAATADPLDKLIDDAARQLPLDPAIRLSLAQATLGLCAEAGMSSLSYSAVAARSGVGTATLQRYWHSKTEAVTAALNEVFRTRPIPADGELRADLEVYLLDIGNALADPRAKAVLGNLIASAACDPDLADALRDRVIAPRRAELSARLLAVPGELAVPTAVAIDQLIGPIYHRALIDGEPVDDALVDAVVGSVVRDNAGRPAP